MVVQTRGKVTWGAGRSYGSDGALAGGYSATAEA